MALGHPSLPIRYKDTPERECVCVRVCVCACAHQGRSIASHDGLSLTETFENLSVRHLPV